MYICVISFQDAYQDFIYYKVSLAKERSLVYTSLPFTYFANFEINIFNSPFKAQW
jgi:hypothetical protein